MIVMKYKIQITSKVLKIRLKKKSEMGAKY